MMRVRLDLETVATVTKQSLQEQVVLKDVFFNGLAGHHNDVKESLGKGLRPN